MCPTCRVAAVVLAVAIASIAVWSGSAQDDIYKLNPTLDTDGKVAVPVNLAAAVAELKRMLHPDLLEEMGSGTEEEMGLYHLGFGTWLRNNWGLWKGSQLSKYFNDLGIFHPDDMSGIILDSLWRDLNDQQIRLDEQIGYYKEYWRQNSYPKKAKCPEHRSRLEWFMSMPDPDVSDSDVTIHVFECRKRGETWIWQVDRGYYEPSPSLLVDIKGE